MIPRLPHPHLQKQWSCGSLYEFLSHVCKENVANLWLEAHSTLSPRSGQRKTVADLMTVRLICFGLIFFKEKENIVNLHILYIMQ